MVYLFNALKNDEAGLVVSAELVAVATLGVIGAVAGLNMAATSVNEELKDVAFAIRSLDQSYSYTGFRNRRAWTAGASYQQEPVEESLQELKALEDEDKDAPSEDQ